MDIREFRKTFRRLERKLESYLNEGTDCCGVTTMQCHTLLEIEPIQPVDLKSLANRLELDKSTVSRTVDTLVSAGLVNREPQPDNRRAVSLTLTDAGQETCNRINTDYDAYMTALVDRIPSGKVEQVFESLSLLTTALETACRECCTRNPLARCAE